MAAGREHIERWLSGTNRELSLDKGYTHPAHSTALPQPETTIVSNSTIDSSPPSLLLPPQTNKSVFPHQSSHISLSKKPGSKSPRLLSVHSLSFSQHLPPSSHSAPSSPSLFRNKLTPSPSDRLSVDKDDQSHTLSPPPRASRHLLTKSVSSDHYLSSDREDSLRNDEYVTEQTLTLLSEHITASKLPLLATQLGLPASVLEDALNEYKLPDTRALYVLRVWLGKEKKEEGGGGGTVSELVSALELIGLYQLAHQVRSGEVKPLKKKLSSDYNVSDRSDKRATSVGGNSRRKPLMHCHGFSLQGEDGERTLIVKDGVQGNHSQVKGSFDF
ncbi:PREDICTED: uncharacterized protein LOC100635180 isoform X2 [Amphimedon queenslandica]|uniref:Death domain-containing protein n=1 Tax=Amphimedon queenslandica TaxID=400682 RepID=A0AAN0IZU4_AMPQE|nr:PREDICTED: uncharacterized protein LOC100635180 isoform X2 [Amphimedon queenslandica]|eukprot:XP_019849983.1 PREDICTED: uncharacterized protein LOC100635180 isoform X2 [Amphimedon queenslandica]